MENGDRPLGTVDDVDEIRGRELQKIMRPIKNPERNQKPDEAKENEEPKLALFLGGSLVFDVLEDPKDRENVVDDDPDGKPGQGRYGQDGPFIEALQETRS